MSPLPGFFPRAAIALALHAAAALGCGGSAGGGGTGGQGATDTGTATATATSTGTTGAGGSGGATGTTGTTSTTWSSTGAGGGMSSSSSSSGGDAGLPPGSGDCLSDADCPGGHCVPLTAGGFRVCQTPPVPTTECGSPQDQCCPGQPCAGGEACLPGPLVPYCGGVPLPPRNQCAVDQCGQDADCVPGQICGLAGALGRGIRACLPAACKTDADCTAAPGGVCAPVREPCCGTTAGLFCVYPGGGCRQSADCGPGQYCLPEGTTGTCQTGAPVCPV